MIVDGSAFHLAVTGLATVSAAVSAVAALAALRSTHASRLTAQGDLIARLLGAHAAPELVDSYHRLVERGPLLDRRSMGTWCPDTDPSLRDVLADGRRLTSFFLQAEVLRRHGIIGDTIFEDIVLSWGAFKFWAQVWVTVRAQEHTGGQPACLNRLGGGPYCALPQAALSAPLVTRRTDVGPWVATEQRVGFSPRRRGAWGRAAA